jgi:hypothetical protein
MKRGTLSSTGGYQDNGGGTITTTNTPMLHIATIQWKTARWISLQQAYLHQHLKSDYRVYAWLNDIPDTPNSSFYYSCSKPVGSHAVKLNILADVICHSSNRNDDILIFLDGDAFPIGDIESLLKQKLSTHKLVAIQRLENDGDVQPHPSFCATTVGFWRSIKGDWKSGYSWRNKYGKKVTDVGGNLLRKLKKNRIAWFPLLRSNKKNLHPVFFGIYGGVIYHHGAGFRKPYSRADKVGLQRMIRSKNLSKAVPEHERTMRRRILRSIVRKNQFLSEKVFTKIQNNPYFYNEFI